MKRHPVTDEFPQTRGEIEALAQEVVESWINGNRSWCYEQVADDWLLAMVVTKLMPARDSDVFVSYCCKKWLAG